MPLLRLRLRLRVAAGFLLALGLLALAAGLAAPAAAQPPTAEPAPLLCGAVVDAAGRPVADAEVALGLLARGRAAPEGAYERRWRDRQVRTAADGSFRFEGLLVGVYRLRAEHGTAGRRELSLHVAPGEHCLPAAELLVELLPPATLEVAVTPPRDPGRRPWKVVVEPAGGAGTVRLVDAAGAVRLPGLPAGRHAVEVREHGSGSGGDRWWRSELWLEGDRRLELDLSPVRLEGRVAVEGRPMPAEVVMELTVAGEGVVRTVRTDEEGRWQGWVPTFTGPLRLRTRLHERAPRSLRGLTLQALLPGLAGMLAVEAATESEREGSRQESSQESSEESAEEAAGGERAGRAAAERRWISAEVVGSQPGQPSGAAAPVVRIDQDPVLVPLTGVVRHAGGASLEGWRVAVTRSGAPAFTATLDATGFFDAEQVPALRQQVAVYPPSPPPAGATAQGERGPGVASGYPAGRPAAWESVEPELGGPSGPRFTSRLEVGPPPVPLRVEVHWDDGRPVPAADIHLPQLGNANLAWDGEMASRTLHLPPEEVPRALVVVRTGNGPGSRPAGQRNRQAEAGAVLWSGCVPVEAADDGGLRLDVRVPRRTGALGLDAGRDGAAVLTADGGVLDSGLLRRWAAERTGIAPALRPGDVLWVPAVAAGAYAAWPGGGSLAGLLARICPAAPEGLDTGLDVTAPTAVEGGPSPALRPLPAGGALLLGAGS